MHTFEQILLCNSLKYSKAFRGKCKKLIQNIQKILGKFQIFLVFLFVDDLTPNKCTIATKLITFSPSNQSGAFISDRNPSLSFPLLFGVTTQKSGCKRRQRDEKSCIPACKKYVFDDAISTYFNATHFSKVSYVSCYLFIC